MKSRKIWWVSLLLALLISRQIIGQTLQPEPANFDRFIKEVYTGKGKKTMKPDTRRYAFMKEFYETRITFIKSDAAKLKKANFTRLSQIPLFDNYNKGLSRDFSFNQAQFNPFKYRLGFYEQERQVIHVDGTDYVIVIQPQKRGGAR